ncbi:MULTISPECIES: hypothetical protein [Stappiaceae]|jgi:hypothetical protein|uniref:hypothetical protein n=1 Tax=Stappiaceae TaxID=2821832 RepID=UPI0011153451|nr:MULTISPECIES: hypothetical protein [Stappiaceae]MBO9463227.1 hypothetical protein [Labrenzia sp. R5_0]UES53886.1 hypothetical protein GFK88_29345 [Roseibium aggregatum]UFI06770.1 hypothetical protein ST40_029135 [Roseibium aggregatum]
MLNLAHNLADGQLVSLLRLTAGLLIAVAVTIFAFLVSNESLGDLPETVVCVSTLSTDTDLSASYFAPENKWDCSENEQCSHFALAGIFTSFFPETTFSGLSVQAIVDWTRYIIPRPHPPKSIRMSLI